MSVSIKAKFTKDTKVYDGLVDVAQNLIERPYDRQVIVAIVETSRITRDIEKGGEDTPTVRLVHVEAMLDDDDKEAARLLLSKRYKERTEHELPDQLALFAGDGSSIDAAMYADGSAPSPRPERDVWLDDDTP